MRRLLDKWIVALVGLLAAAVLVSVLTGWPLGSTPASSRGPSQAGVAAQLAKRLTTARTPAKRYSALVAIMKELRVGVYKGDGRPIVRGAEREKNDLYVYDFTLKLLAQAMGHHKTTTVNELAAELNAATATVRKRPVTGKMLRSALQSGTRWAINHPRSEDATAQLLLRDIGLSRVHQDPARPPALGRMKLDEAQAFLVNVGVTAQIVNQARRSGHAGAARAPVPTRGASALGDLCAGAKPLYKFYKTLNTAAKLAAAAKLGAALSQAGLKVALQNLTTGAINAKMINELVTFWAMSDANQRSHFGPSWHSGSVADAGHEIGFRANLRVFDKVPELLAKCGYLTGLTPIGGFKAPGSGGVPNIPVEWKYQPNVKSEDQLESLGSVQHSDSTDVNGTVWLHFTPKDEPLVGVGQNKVSVGSIVANANVQEAIGGPLLDISPNFWATIAPKFVVFVYDVSGHRAHGYKFTASGDWVDDSGGAGYDVVNTIEGRVCPDTPWAPWTFTVNGEAHPGYGGEFSFSESGSSAFPGLDQPIVTSASYRDGVVWNMEATILKTDPATMRIRPVAPRHGPTVVVPISDTGC